MKSYFIIYLFIYNFITGLRNGIITDTHQNIVSYNTKGCLLIVVIFIEVIFQHFNLFESDQK